MTNKRYAPHAAATNWLARATLHFFLTLPWWPSQARELIIQPRSHPESDGQRTKGRPRRRWTLMPSPAAKPQSKPAATSRREQAWHHTCAVRIWPAIIYHPSPASHPPPPSSSSSGPDSLSPRTSNYSRMDPPRTASINQVIKRQ